jgi:hypothetical protein
MVMVLPGEYETTTPLRSTKGWVKAEVAITTATSSSIVKISGNFFILSLLRSVERFDLMLLIPSILDGDGGHYQTTREQVGSRTSQQWLHVCVDDWWRAPKGKPRLCTGWIADAGGH